MDFSNSSSVAEQRAGMACATAAAGPDADFGIMGVVNLAHGGFICWALIWRVISAAFGSSGHLGGAVLSVVFGLGLEWLLFRHFYKQTTP
jgi:branched-chain amino acid transport system permease protein